jgi:hypothetical protein
MQRLDPAGNYSDAEVISALTAQRGTRRMTYRFDRLNADNEIVERSIDGVVDGKVENNALADIKRTASFEIRDDATIDYASDRLLPWARLEIPAALNPTMTLSTYVEDPADAGTFIPGG